MAKLDLLYIFFVLFFLTGSILCQNVIDPSIQLNIDNFIAQYMEDKHIPGLGLAIVQDNGSVLYEQGYGLANIEDGIFVNKTTLFSIGSITKSMTAVIVLKTLTEKFPELGFEVLNTPISILAPTYNFTLIDKYRSEKVTFKDLLAHRVCTLAEGMGMWVQAYSGQQDMFYRHRYAPAVCNLRDNYVYNNGLIALAGDIVAHMMNSTYDEMLRSFLDDVGMTDTTWVKETDNHNSMSGRAVPYIWKDQRLMRYNAELLKSAIIVNAAGAVLSSASDMLKYANFHLNLGKVGERQIVPADAMLWMRGNYNPSGYGVVKTEQNPNARIDLTAGYGLCVNVGIHDGWVKVSHGGYLPPFESFLSLYPDLKLGIFTSWNGPGTMYYSDFSVEQVHARIFDFVMGTQKETPRRNTAAFGPYQFRPAVTVPQATDETKASPKLSLEEIAGNYGSGFNGDMSITLWNSTHAYWEYGLWGRGWLDQISNSTFRIEWDSDFWMMAWTNGLGMLNSTLNFLDTDTVQYLEEGVQATTNFIRGLIVDDLPEIPWAPGSCLNV